MLYLAQEKKTAKTDVEQELQAISIITLITPI